VLLTLLESMLSVHPDIVLVLVLHSVVALNLAVDQELLGETHEDH
jgi:hypothetical protein